MKKKKRNIIPYRRRFHLNIGIIIFAVVFVYFLICFISYLTRSSVSVYEVQYGQIANNQTYTGLALRQESVVYAEDSGSVNYYKKEGDKAGYNDLICSIDETGQIADEITQAGLDAANLSEEELLDIQDTITGYVSSYSDMQFYNVYAFKENVNAEIQENLYLSALNNLSEQTSTAVSQNTFSFVRTSADGILALYTDGYEGVTADTFTSEMFNPASYVKINLQGNTQVTSGQALYKLSLSEDWTIMVPISEEEAASYRQNISEGEDSFVLHVKFLKDGTQTNADASVQELNGSCYLKLDLNNSMVRFISDRYLEVSLGSNDNKGLKIPNSAITEKEFIVVPKDYIGKGDNSSGSGIIKITTDKKGNESAEFISTDLYYETNDAYYIAEDEISVGDTIQMPDSTQQYVLKETATRKGVYNMDKGYAIFKQIEVLSENEEYSVVATGTSYGLTLYDHIALNGDEVQEGDFLN